MQNISRYRGCLLAGAAGDALGYPVEFLDESAIFARYGKPGIRAYELAGGVAEISDDTQMTMFTAAGLLAASATGGDTLDALAASYQDWLRTQRSAKPAPGERGASWLVGVPALWSRRAPGNTCMGALLAGQPVAGSCGCGGVMRVAPIGLYLGGGECCSQDGADRLGGAAAALTHGGDLGYIPAAMQVHIVSLAAHRAGMDLAAIVDDALAAVARLYADAPHIGLFTARMERAAALARSGTDDLDAIHQLGEGWTGDEALAIAVFCALRYSDDLERALTAAVNHRGDSDSTGAVAGNILGAYLGEEAIPDKYLRDLELRQEIVTLADDLFAGGPAPGGESAWRRRYALGAIR